jgi:hypothetical protein
MKRDPNWDRLCAGDAGFGDALIGLAIGLVLLFAGTRIPYRILRWPVLALGVLFVVVMAGYLIAVVWKNTSPVLRRVVSRARGHVRKDPQLGTLTRDVKNRCWEGTLKAGNRSVDVLIDGDAEPAPALLAHARELAADLGGLDRRLAAYLAEEAKEEQDPEFAAEIGALRASKILLLSSRPPGHVEIDFDGSDDGRFWSCRYVRGQLSGLRFDN